MCEVEDGQGTTTLMPGNATLVACGCSGGYAYLGMRGRARTLAIIDVLEIIDVIMDHSRDVYLK